MRYEITAALWFLCAISARAVEIVVGGTPVDVPIPEGFAEVTPEMAAIHTRLHGVVPPTNDLYLALIPNELVEDARAGGDMDLPRYFLVQGTKQLTDHQLTAEEFAALKSEVRDELDRARVAMEQNLPSTIGDAIDAASSRLALEHVDMVNLPFHQDTGNVLAYCATAKFGLPLEDGGTRDMIVSYTTAFVYANGKVLFLYTYGGEDDMDWCRTTSEEWANATVAANPEYAGPAAMPELKRDAALSRILRMALIGGAVGALAGLIALIAKKALPKPE